MTMYHKVVETSGNPSQINTAKQIAANFTFAAYLPLHYAKEDCQEGIARRRYGLSLKEGLQQEKKLRSRIVATLLYRMESHAHALGGAAFTIQNDVDWINMKFNDYVGKMKWAKDAIPLKPLPLLDPDLRPMVEQPPDDRCVIWFDEMDLNSWEKALDADWEYGGTIGGRYVDASQPKDSDLAQILRKVTSSSRSILVLSRFADSAGHAFYSLPDPLKEDSTYEFVHVDNDNLFADTRDRDEVDVPLALESFRDDGQPPTGSDDDHKVKVLFSNDAVIRSQGPFDFDTVIFYDLLWDPFRGSWKWKQKLAEEGSRLKTVIQICPSASIKSCLASDPAWIGGRDDQGIDLRHRKLRDLWDLKEFDVS